MRAIEETNISKKITKNISSFLRDIADAVDDGEIEIDFLSLDNDIRQVSPVEHLDTGMRFLDLRYREKIKHH
jgi:hypothetical protein